VVIFEISVLPVFIQMLQLARVMAPDLLQKFRSDANLIHQIFSCAYIDIGILVCTYIFYLHTYTSSRGEARGLGSQESWGALVICLLLMGGAPPEEKQKNKMSLDSVWVEHLFPGHGQEQKPQSHEHSHQYLFFQKNFTTEKLPKRLEKRRQ